MKTNHTARIERLQAWLTKEQPADVVLVTEEVNVRYLTGFTGDSTYLFVTPTTALLLSDMRYELQLAQQCPDIAALVRGPDRRMIDLIKDGASQLNIKRLGLEPAAVSWDLQLLMQRELPSVELTPIGDPVGELRMIKDESELAILRRAVWIAERAFESVRARLRPCITELQIAHELENAIRELGGEGCGFPAIVGAGAGGALPHYKPGDIELGGNRALLIDWGAKYCGYTSDLTRTLHREPPPAEFRDAYEAVLAAHNQAIAAMRPGAEAKEIDRVARTVLDDAGLGPRFKHGLGHGIGLKVHESPRMSKISTEVLREGMVITVEPAVYFEHQFGIRIENDVLITATGAEVLSTLPSDYASNRFSL